MGLPNRKVAYGIQIHENPSQFRRLFDQIYNSTDVFSVHVDQKTDPETADQLFRIASRGSNIHLLPRIPIWWGCWENARVELDSIAFLLELDGAWSHFINLSGACFPLKTRVSLLDHLHSDPTRSFVDMGIDVRTRGFLRQRYQWSWVSGPKGPVRTDTPKPPPLGFEVEYDGEAWHILSRPFCEWLTKDDLALRIRRFFQDAAHPDELLMQCLIRNSPYRAAVGPVAWKTVWSTGALHPDTLTSAHTDMLLKSEAFFARKFDERRDAKILDLLTSRLNAMHGIRDV